MIFSDTILITIMSTFHVLGVDLVERCKSQGFKVFCHLVGIGCRGFGTKYLTSFLIKEEFNTGGTEESQQNIRIKNVDVY